MANFHGHQNGKGPKYQKSIVFSTTKNPNKAEFDQRNSQPHQDQKINETSQHQKYPLSSPRRYKNQIHYCSRRL